MQKTYSRINWENYPSGSTPINESNLNKMDIAINEIDDRIIQFDTTKLDKTSANALLKGFALDEETGVITLTYYNGSTQTISTNLAKVAVNVSYDSEMQCLVLTMPDGAVSYVDMTELITMYEFVASDTIYFEIDYNGKVSAKIKNGSITEEHLQTDYLADIKVETANSAQNREIAETSALQAKEYAEQAQQYASQALSTTPDGYNQTVADVDLLKNSIIQTTERTLYGSNAGGIKLIGIGGASEQGENPNPDYPQEIESVGDSGSLGIKAEGKNLAHENYIELYASNDTKLVAQSTGIRSLLIKVKPNTTYLLGRNGGTRHGTIGYLKDVPKVGDSVNVAYLRSSAKRSITTLEDTNYILWYNGASSAMPTEVFCYETTDTTAEYEPYRSKSVTIPLNEPLRGIGDIRDEVVCQDGVWGVLRRFNTQTMTGTEERGYNGATSNQNDDYLMAYCICITNIAKNNNFSTTGNMLCDVFYPLHRIYSADVFAEGVAIHQVGTESMSRFEIRIKRERLATNDFNGLKKWLSENPVTVVYELATPTFEPFTDQTPFYGLESFDTVTYISTDSEVEPSIELKFAKTEGDAITLGNYNRTKRNEIHISELMALQTELAAALVAGSEG